MQWYGPIIEIETENGGGELLKEIARLGAATIVEEELELAATFVEEELELAATIIDQRTNGAAPWMPINRGIRLRAK